LRGFCGEIEGAVLAINVTPQMRGAT